jgi:hypothetical protein
MGGAERTYSLTTLLRLRTALAAGSGAGVESAGGSPE